MAIAQVVIEIIDLIKQIITLHPHPLPSPTSTEVILPPPGPVATCPTTTQPTASTNGICLISIFGIMIIFVMWIIANSCKPEPQRSGLALVASLITFIAAFAMLLIYLLT